MTAHIHEDPAWPQFQWGSEKLAVQLAAVHREQGRLLGRMEALGLKLRQDAVLETLTEDVLKSSEIEGERLDAGQVRSSVARRLGIDIGRLEPVERSVEGVVEMMLDATRQYEKPLTEERLFAWHASLFPTGCSGMRPIRVGAWRDDHDGPLQIVSGPVGRELVHFQAPAASRLDGEMKGFLAWFNGNEKSDWVVRAGIAHLWFVTIHPFDDGNGRIARAIADMALARSEGSSERFYSMSAQIQQERAAYYDILGQTQKGGMDITPWMAWFLGCLGRAIERAQGVLGTVLSKARFWESVEDFRLNERQRLVLNRLLVPSLDKERCPKDGVVGGFEGKLTTSKWAKLAQCSHDTALRDIAALVQGGILMRNAAGGRSTSYALAKTAESSRKE